MCTPDHLTIAKLLLAIAACGKRLVKSLVIQLTRLAHSYAAARYYLCTRTSTTDSLEFKLKKSQEKNAILPLLSLKMEVVPL